MVAQELQSGNARRRGRPRIEAVPEEALQGFRFFRRIRALLEALRPCGAHQNRLLHFDEYAALVLLYFFNPTIVSLRSLQQVSGFEKVQKMLGIRRMSLGSMSESVRVFDPDLLRDVFEGLARRAPRRSRDLRLRDVQDVLTVVDGTILRALPRMAWAVWLGDRGKGVKAHIQYEVMKDIPVRMDVTEGNASEAKHLKAHLQAGRLYVLDRGYREYALVQAIVDADSSVVVRLQENAVYEVLEDREISCEDKRAGVVADRIVRLGSYTKKETVHQPVRIVEVEVAQRAPRGLGYHVKKVSSKKSFREEPGHAYRMFLLTDRFDLPADIVALIYQHRWKVELFFRVLKSVLGCRHLLSDSIEGVSIQIYCALIAALLLAEYTGLKLTRRVYELVTFYLQGWVSDEELLREIARLRSKAAAQKS